MRQPRVLVVDDDPAVRELLVRALNEVGYVVVAAPHGKAGLEAAQGDGFDLVITNSYVPVPGEQLIGHLRRLFLGLPILHLDNVKPFSIGALEQAVALAIRERSQRQEA